MLFSKCIVFFEGIGRLAVEKARFSPYLATYSDSWLPRQTVGKLRFKIIAEFSPDKWALVGDTNGR
ncbi:hypothetical protein AVL56_06540 [Alteromonas stellipolaris]|nr:hypothetical protein AVL56_06540 [Alteromonas stellipolaris]ANB26989.1 hypothetical protein A6F57_18495 [Alteromonas stellipolaris]